MTLVGAWLKQLILVVLLAVFADLLLPTKAMQKYVRLVMGISIIAVILQPMVPFFNRDWADRAASMATKEVLGNSNATASPASPDASQLQDTLQAQKDEEANRMVAGQIVRQITTAFRVTPITVAVTGIGHTQGSIRVAVSLSAADGSKSDDVQRFVANQLQIDAAQVSVTAQ